MFFQFTSNENLYQSIEYALNRYQMVYESKVFIVANVSKSEMIIYMRLWAKAKGITATWTCEHARSFIIDMADIMKKNII